MSGCGIYSKYKDETEVPENLYGDYVDSIYSSQDDSLYVAYSSLDTVDLGTVEWREFFTDPLLQALIEKGLENNTDYLTAEQRVKEAEATLLSSKLSFLPSLAFTPDISVTHTHKASPQASQSYTIPVTASWELDFFGKMRNAKRQSQVLLEQTKYYRQAVRTQVIAGIANAYYTILMLDEQVAIAKETEEAWAETIRSARALMKAGRYNEAGVAQLEASYYSVQTTVLDLEEQLNQAENSLAMLLAETPRHYERGTLDNQSFPVNFYIGVPLDILANRPDVRYAEMSLASAFYNTNYARSSFYPSITLSGSAGWTNAGTVIRDPISFIASAVGSLTEPLFNRGALLGQLKIAKAQEEEASLNFQQTLLNAGTEVNNALMSWQTASAKRELLDNQIKALESAYKSTSLLMQYGTTTYLEVLTAQQSLLSARLTQVSNQVAEIQSIIDLYQALGGGKTEEDD